MKMTPSIPRLQETAAVPPVRCGHGRGGKSGLPFTAGPGVGSERTGSRNGAPEIKQSSACGSGKRRETANVNTFLCDCLYAFAGCTVLGIVPPFVIAGKARQPLIAVVTLLIVGFVIFVLVTAATKL
jgi:hypothetical protein